MLGYPVEQTVQCGRCGSWCHGAWETDHVVRCVACDRHDEQVLAEEQALVPPGWASVDGGVVDDDAVCEVCGRLQDTCWCHVKTSAWHRTEGGAS
jgi:hypothetical protein